MNRRRILKGVANVVASWRMMLARFFPAASQALRVVDTGAAPLAPELEVAAAVLNPDHQDPPTFEDYATIEAQVDGVPVYCLDYMTYVYGAAPDLAPGTVMQEGNSNPLVKIKPKKSWEIKSNLLASNTAQLPRSLQNDFQNFLPIHLIDGDPGTVWCSFGSITPDVHPEWIRIDLPLESIVASVALVLSDKNYPGTNFGRSLPKELTVKLSRDAWHWETVHESKDVDIETADVLEVKFPSRRAKQIWVVGNNFTKPLGIPALGFSIASLEVRDASGTNLALVSRGAGVTVSSTCFTHSDNRLTQQALWGPLHYDTGTKWIRSICDGPYQWWVMEKQRGRYEVDPVMDRWLADAHRCGINLIMNLDITAGNPIYQNPPKQVNWVQARSSGVLYEPPFAMQSGGWVDQTPEMLDAWLKYVEFLVRHFKDRAYIWEVGNEWNGWGYDDQIITRYINVFEMTYQAAKRADPNARIMPGSVDLWSPDLLLTMLGEERKAGLASGALIANGGDPNDLSRTTLVLTKGDAVHDAEVRVDALNRGTWGILLRYRDPQNFLMAGYGTYMKPIPGLTPYMVFITERTGDSWTTTEVSAKDVGSPFSDKLHFTVKVEGTVATLNVSDSYRQVTVTHRIKNPELDQSGRLGLLHLTGGGQRFQNFQVHDLQGRVVFNEEFHGENGALPAGWEYVFGPYLVNPVKPGWAAKLDGLGWHPTVQPDAEYFAGVRELQRRCRELGFQGRFYDTEMYFFFNYPRTPGIDLSELGQGIMTMISATGHSGLDMPATTQILEYTGHACEASNCRQSWPSEVCVPVQPSVMYYMWRTLANVLDDFHPADFQVRLAEREKFLWFTFERGTRERMVAVWLDHQTKPNEIVDTRTDLTLTGIRVRQAWVVDLMNGTEQEVGVTKRGEDTVFAGLRVKNYPTIIRFSQSDFA